MSIETIVQKPRTVKRAATLPDSVESRVDAALCELCDAIIAGEKARIRLAQIGMYVSGVSFATNEVIFWQPADGPKPTSAA